MGRLRAPVAAGLATLAVACVLFPGGGRAARRCCSSTGRPPRSRRTPGRGSSCWARRRRSASRGVPWAPRPSGYRPPVERPVVGGVGAARGRAGGRRRRPASAGRVLAAWGPGATPGLWAAVVLGVAAVGLAVGRPRVGAVPVVAAALVGGLAAGLLPATGTAVADGPFVRLADLADGGPLRSGATALPAADLELTLIDGSAAAVTADGIATFGHGHVDVVARVPADDRVRHAGGILGVAGDRVARFVAPGTLLVTGLRPGDPTAVRVQGVAEASAVGSDGTVWLRGYGEPAAAVRRLDLHAYSGAVTLDVTVLPVVTVDAPVGAAPLAAADLLPVPDGALRRTATRLERVTAAPGRTVVTPLAGGLDPVCGLTAVARSATLGAPGPFAAHPGRRRLAGGERAAPARRTGRRAARRSGRRCPGPPSPWSRRRTAASSSRRGRASGRWRRTRPSRTCRPPAPTACPTRPPPGRPPRWCRSRTRAPTGWARRSAWTGAGRAAPATARSAPSPRTAAPACRWAGGWTPRPARSGRTGRAAPGGWRGRRPVHARPARPETRLPPVPLPASSMSLVPDLGDRPPLVATPEGAYRLDGTRVVDGPVTGGVVRADGRGWLLAGGRVLALADGRVLGPVIDGTGPGAPVPVQLAKGVPAARLVLGDASLGLDAQGRAAVLADGVVLAVTTDGVAGGAGPAADRLDHRRGRPRAARRQRRAAAGGAAGLGRLSPRRRARLPAVVSRRAVARAPPRSRSPRRPRPRPAGRSARCRPAPTPRRPRSRSTAVPDSTTQATIAGHRQQHDHRGDRGQRVVAGQADPDPGGGGAQHDGQRHPAGVERDRAAEGHPLDDVGRRLPATAGRTPPPAPPAGRRSAARPAAPQRAPKASTQPALNTRRGGQPPAGPPVDLPAALRGQQLVDRVAEEPDVDRRPDQRTPSPRRAAACVVLATTPIGSPIAPLPAIAATTICATASTATAALRRRGRASTERWEVTVMAPIIDLPANPG